MYKLIGVKSAGVTILFHCVVSEHCSLYQNYVISDQMPEE